MSSLVKRSIVMLDKVVLEWACNEYCDGSVSCVGVVL